MSGFRSPCSCYYDLACVVGQLRFHGLLEGRIPKLFYTLHVDDIKHWRLRKHAGHWCNSLILQLLQVTHHQWTF